jgi:hypothetical protein
MSRERRRGRGEGSVYQRHDGRWTAAASIGFRHGKRVRRHIYSATKGEVKALLARAGLPPMRLHDLRHSTATLLPSKGVHPRIVMETLGHSQISLTMDTYTHSLPTLQAEAAARLDEALGEIGCQNGCQNEKGSSKEPQESQISEGNLVSRGGIELPPPTERVRNFVCGA